MSLLLALAVALASPAAPITELDSIGKSVDIASSAYQFRADRKPDANDPESWIALMHAAHLPLNKPVDLRAPGVTHALSGLLWEEIRPIQVLELTWPDGAKRVPTPAELQIAALINNGSASSWWNNLGAVVQNTTAAVTNNGRTYTYPLGQNSCGLVVSVTGGKDAKAYDVPEVRVLTADTWKHMDLEVEWGFDSATAGKDYSGHLESYDGRVSAVEPLSTNTSVTGNTWKSAGKSADRRGVKMSLLYQGISKWRKVQPYTTQAEDVARTIVTIWTKAGSFSFLAADLENGPILAPEYGFFVRRTSDLGPTPDAGALPKVTLVPFSTRIESDLGNENMKGWGTPETPLLIANPSAEVVSSQGVTIPPYRVVMHPGANMNAVAEWTSPVDGKVKLAAAVTHAQNGGRRVDAAIVQSTVNGNTLLNRVTTSGTGTAQLASGSQILVVNKGDKLSLVIGHRGDYHACTVLTDFTLTEQGGEGRAWDLSRDVAHNPLTGNPHADGYGNPAVWRFGSEMPLFIADGAPSQPPIELASSATSAKQFEQELSAKHLQTIREQLRSHSEMTWEEAVTATRGPNWPELPKPPAGSEPKMQIEVPDKRLNDQWNLGAWHMVRHCATNPTTGKLWFNDFPYGILAAETYMVLEVLDLMGSHDAAGDGYQQWTSLPMDRNPPEHPVGLFSDGHGALNGAVGPDGAGGQMDVVHAFGPGSIGWALTQHYWLTGDKAWLKSVAPRIEANAEWMLRQRHTISDAVPGGNRMWCNGLEPPLQVTPDSGGLWMHFYEAQAYYWASIERLAPTIAEIDPAGGAKLKAEAAAFRADLSKAVDRSIALSPVMPVRDGTYHSVVPFACYCRGMSTGAWGFGRDGSGTHVGQLYWDTVQSAAALISPAVLLSPDDPRVQGYLDVLEDRPLQENANVGDRDYFYRGWQYQGGLERTPNMHLATDDIPVFIRSFLNCYAVDILPNSGYVFNEHAVHGPPDKIFEEAAFLERFRNLLVMEEGSTLWLAKGTPRAWLTSGEHISVKNAPTRFGDVSYSIESHLDAGQIDAVMEVPDRAAAREIWLRLRHPQQKVMKSVIVNGKTWKDFDAAKEVVRLHGLTGHVTIQATY